ncbi:MAG: LysR family transcriptional regulator [Eubacteriales bacterium]|nr:LysR family transcriptional regulator [Eubacteriales bacterium]
MRTGALIVASLPHEREYGSNEESPTFLPMLPLDGTTVIKREIAVLRRAGISPIIVLCGYQKEVLKNHLIHNGVIFCEDEKFKEHTQRQSTDLGLSFAKDLCERVLVLPVEYPVFSAATVRTLLESREDCAPQYQGKKGFPRLYYLGKAKGEEELTGLCVEDPGILYSIENAEDEERVRQYARDVRDANELRIKQKVILAKEEDFFGPGVYELLIKIGETGSIQSAAREMGMSYSKGWKMVNRVEEEMGFPFLNRLAGGKSGGSSTLTQEGRIFLERYHALVTDLGKMTRNFFDVYFRDFQ